MTSGGSEIETQMTSGVLLRFCLTIGDGKMFRHLWKKKSRTKNFSTLSGKNWEKKFFRFTWKRNKEKKIFVALHGKCFEFEAQSTNGRGTFFVCHTRYSTVDEQRSLCFAMAYSEPRPPRGSATRVYTKPRFFLGFSSSNFRGRTDCKQTSNPDSTSHGPHAKRTAGAFRLYPAQNLCDIQRKIHTKHSFLHVNR